MANRVAGQRTPGGEPAQDTRATTAAVLTGLAVALYIAAMIVAEDDNGWLWPLAGLVGLAAAITGWSAGRPRPRGRSLAAVVIGGLIFLVILGWVVVAAISGDL